MTKENPIHTAKAYNNYYGNGLYDGRYPAANPSVMARILVHITALPSSSIVLDYGCGSGRYLQQILQQTPTQVYGFDISDVAIAQATHRLRNFRHRVSLFSIRGSLERALKHRHGVDVALLLFGVLAHINGKSKRHEVLQWIRRQLKSESGRLIVSVPNRFRRFWWLQIKNILQPEDGIIYQRVQGHEKIFLYYHLYSCRELVSELEKAGFQIQRLSAESFFPEKWVTRYSWLARVDKALCQKIPPSMGYGILAEARRAK